jgi:hypothetical protein
MRIFLALALAVVSVLVSASVSAQSQNQSQHDHAVIMIEHPIIDAIEEDARLGEEIKNRKFFGFIKALMPTHWFGKPVECADRVLTGKEELDDAALVEKYNEKLNFIHEQRGKLYQFDSAEAERFDRGKGLVRLDKPMPTHKVQLRCSPPRQKPPPPRNVGSTWQCRGFLAESQQINGPVGRRQTYCMYQLCMANGGQVPSRDYNRCQ